MRVAELLYTYEKYGVEILGAAVAVLLVMQCVQLFRVRKLRKQLNKVVGRQQLKDEMERMGRRSSIGKENVRVLTHSDEAARGQAHSGEAARGQTHFSEDVGVREQAYDLSEDQSQLISEVLGEIFP